MITKDKVKELIDNRPEGTTPEDVINGLLSRGHQLEGFEMPEPEQEPGFVKGIVQETVQAPARLAKTGMGVVEGVAAIQGLVGDVIRAPFSKEKTVRGAVSEATQKLEALNKDTEESDWGWFGGKVRRIGVTESGEQLKGARMVADAAGVGAETASFALPFKASTGAGFWKSTWQGMKSAPALSFGLGTGLQQYAESGSIGQGAAQGALDVVGSGVAFGVFNKGGQMLQNFGARLLSKEVTPMLANETKNIFESIWNSSMGNALGSKTMTIDEVKVAQQFKEQYRVFEDAFNQNLYKHATNLIDESRQTYVQNAPEVIMRDLAQGVKREVNAFFELPKATYNSFDQSGFKFESFPKTFSTYNPENIKKLTVDDLVASRPELDGAIKAFSKSGLTPNEIAVELKIDTPSSGAFDSFMSGVMEKLKSGQLGAKDLLNTAYSLFGINDRTIKKFTPEEQSLARSVGASIFADAEEQLINSGRKDLLDIWKTGATQWQQALKLSESNTLNNLAEAGNIDNFVSKVIDSTADLNLDEKKVLNEIFTQNPTESEKLFINGILDRVEALIKPARGQMPTPETLAEGAKFIDKFLEKRGVFDWAGTVMTDDKALNLRLLSDFMKTNFSDALARTKQMSGAIPEAEKNIYEMIQDKGKLDVVEAIKKTDFYEFSDGLLEALKKHPQEIKPYINRLSDQQRHIARVSLTGRLLEESKTLAIPDENGKIVVTESVKDSLIKTYFELKKIQMGAGDDTIFGLIDKSHVEGLEQIVSNITRERQLKDLEPMSLKPFVRLALGSFFATQHWMFGAINQFRQAGATSIEQKELRNLVAEELTRMAKKGKIITIGDMLQAIARFSPVPIQTQEAVTDGVGGEQKPEFNTL